MRADLVAEPVGFPAAERELVAASPPSPAAVQRRWRRLLPLAVAGADVLAVTVALILAARLAPGATSTAVRVGGRALAPESRGPAIVLAWFLTLAAHRAYAPAVVGSVQEEPRRILRAGIAFFGLLAVVDLLGMSDVSSRWVILVVALATVLTLIARLLAERIVQHARERHRWMRRAVVYGGDAEADALAKLIKDAPQWGLDVVDTCRAQAGTPARAGFPRTAGGGSPTALADAPADERLREILSSTGADVLAVAAGTPPGRLRRLVWGLEGTGVDVLVAPAIADVAQHPLTPHQVGEVPLLRVEGCRLARAWLVAKVIVDRVGAGLLLLMLSPVLLAAAVAVKLSSPGPVLYQQTRVGQHGRPFSFLKLRTMVCDADARLAEVAGRNEADGLLFKIHDDPRITPVGRFLRRASIDELPQLWNVVRGDMSLVGPRPLPVPPDAFVGDARRRLRVRPGITGLWQVSGRSDLSWEDTIRLDVQYVDRWSLLLDLTILLRTPVAVVRARGAY